MRRFVLATILLATPAAAQGIVADTSDGAVVRAEAQTLRAACGGGDARIEGNHNTIVLTGQCRSLLVKGVGNTVAIDLRPGAAIRVEGSGNRVSFPSVEPAPAVEIFGPDNTAGLGSLPPAPAPPPPTAAASPAPLPPPVPMPPRTAADDPGPLQLDGADQSQQADCTGRNVVAAGIRSAYVLRGGCKSITVRGDLITIQAELQPGSHITVNGRGITVLWAQRDRGALPIAQVRGEGSRVQRTDTIGGQPVR